MNTIQEEQTTSPEKEEPPISYDDAKLERLVFGRFLALLRTPLVDIKTKNNILISLKQKPFKEMSFKDI